VPSADASSSSSTNTTSSTCAANPYYGIVMRNRPPPTAREHLDCLEQISSDLVVLSLRGRANRHDAASVERMT
jgi:hypothetical protein